MPDRSIVTESEPLEPRPTPSLEEVLNRTYRHLNLIPSLESEGYSCLDPGACEGAVEDLIRRCAFDLYAVIKTLGQLPIKTALLPGRLPQPADRRCAMKGDDVRTEPERRLSDVVFNGVSYALYLLKDEAEREEFAHMCVAWATAKRRVTPRAKPGRKANIAGLTLVSNREGCVR